MDERHQTPWAERVLVERLSGGDDAVIDREPFRSGRLNAVGARRAASR